MKAPAKIGLVAAGYVGAVLIASAVVAIHAAATSGPDRQGAHGMYAFGDSFFFLAAFGVAAVVSTGAALFFLRPYPSFWRPLSIAALVIAATGVAAVIEYLAGRSADAGSVLRSWSALAVLRILVAPLVALFFLLSAALAPHRSYRIALFGATLIEAAVFVYLAVAWVLPSRSPGTV